MNVELSQKILDHTIEAAREYQLRLEVEAAALAQLPGEDAEQLALERLRQARQVKELFEIYIHL